MAAARRTAREVGIRVNGERFSVQDPPDTPLLWVLRDTLGLTGTKYGCGIGVCGACTVHVDGRPARACLVPVRSVVDAEVTTIEGLSRDGDHPVQRIWVEEDVAQCGYCQPGWIMTMAALVDGRAGPTEEELGTALDGHLCRCGTLQRLRRAIRRAAGLEAPPPDSGGARG